MFDAVAGLCLRGYSISGGRSRSIGLRLLCLRGLEIALTLHFLSEELLG